MSQYRIHSMLRVVKPTTHKRLMVHRLLEAIPVIDVGIDTAFRTIRARFTGFKKNCTLTKEFHAGRALFKLSSNVESPQDVEALNEIKNQLLAKQEPSVGTAWFVNKPHPHQDCVLYSEDPKLIMRLYMEFKRDHYPNLPPEKGKYVFIYLTPKPFKVATLDRDSAYLINGDYSKRVSIQDIWSHQAYLKFVEDHPQIKEVDWLYSRRALKLIDRVSEAYDE